MRRHIVLKAFFYMLVIGCIQPLSFQAHAIDFQAYERKLERQKNEFGLEHPSTLSVMYMLAEVYKLHGKFSDAKALYRQLIKLSAQGANRDFYPETTLLIDNLANVYLRQGMYDKAESLYKQSMQRRIQLYGQNHPSMAYSNYYLATLYSMQGRYLEAERLYMRNIKIQQDFDLSDTYVHWLVRNDIKQLLDNSARNLEIVNQMRQAGQPSESAALNSIN